jgi:hypothetical protein
LPLLEPGEQTVLGENAKYRGTSGYLTLTNRRLIFETQSGVITKRTYTSLDLALHEIGNVTVEGALGKKLIVGAKSGQIMARHEFSVRDPYSWQNQLMQLRKTIGVTTAPMEWICPKCTNSNSADTPRCLRCGMPKPG